MHRHGDMENNAVLHDLSHQRNILIIEHSRGTTGRIDLRGHITSES